MSVLHARVAGLRVDFLYDGDAPRGLERWAPFACGPGGEEVAIALAPGPPAAAGGRLTGKVALDGGVWRPCGAERLGWLDPATGRGVAPSSPNVFVADTLARAAVARSVAARGGVLLHAAAVVVDGWAHLVAGRSGAGKSTFAGLSRQVLSDELVAVFPGAGGAPPRVHATPWWSSGGGDAPLATVYRLAWADAAVRPLRGPGLLRHLAQGIVLPLETPEERARAFAVCGALARAVPFAELAFRPDTDVDALLRRAAGRRAA